MSGAPISQNGVRSKCSVGHMVRYIPTDVASLCLLPAIPRKFNISDVRWLYCDRPTEPPELFTAINTTFRTVPGKKIELQSRRNERVASHRADAGEVGGKFTSWICFQKPNEDSVCSTIMVQMECKLGCRIGPPTGDVTECPAPIRFPGDVQPPDVGNSQYETPIGVTESAQVLVLVLVLECVVDVG